jgi:hypothetical protein
MKNLIRIGKKKLRKSFEDETEKINKKKKRKNQVNIGEPSKPKLIS